MKIKQSTVLLILLLASPLFLSCILNPQPAAAQTSLPLYFGVDVAYGDIAETKQLIDNVSSYTNFFIVGCSGDYNLTRLTEITQYVYNKGLNFLVFTDDPRYPSKQWLQTANTAYGSKFMGIYFYDEAGGRQLDQAKYPTVTSAENYSDAADKYVRIMNWWLRNSTHAITKSFPNATNYPLFTSDYALYWWDYQSGYDTVFAEFGDRSGNLGFSRQLNVAFCRGAATVYNKDWGVMITWSYNEPPYMENGTKLYNDMVLAYANGAKYIIIFDSNENYTDNVLQQEHLDAMKEFWEYAQNNPRTVSPASERTAAILPEDYAYGFRGPDDKIWGLWQADELTVNISTSVMNLMQTYGGSLDIIYPSPNQESVGYKNLIYWNGTTDPQVNPVLPYYGNTLYLWAIGASIVVIVVAAVVLLRFRNPHPKKPLLA